MPSAPAARVSLTTRSGSGSVRSSPTVFLNRTGPRAPAPAATPSSIIRICVPAHRCTTSSRRSGRISSALAPEVREEFTKHYVAYKTRTNFTDVVPQKRRLLLTLNMRFDDISDPRRLAADITNLGRWGNGDVQLEVDNARQVPYAMELVRQALAAKQPGGAKGSEGQSRHVRG